MELGGNAPFLVFADADLDAAVEGAMVAKMRNVGEACTAANRFLVEEAVAEEFAARLAERIAALRTGRGTEPGVDVGPLIDDGPAGQGRRARRGRRAIAAPGCSCGGEESPDAATSTAHAPHRRTPRREAPRTGIFGPVAPIATFATEAEALEAANRTEYGLVAYLYTNDLARAFRVAERLQTGMVGVNQGIVSNAAAPFGGVKHSGFGREGGFEGIDEYLETKYVALAV